MTNSIDKLRESLNQKLDEVGEFNSGFILGMASFYIKEYSKRDWQDYAKETGNEIPEFKLNKSLIEAMIDESTGFKDMNDKTVLQFLIWCVDGFMEGVNEELQ